VGPSALFFGVLLYCEVVREIGSRILVARRSETQGWRSDRSYGKRQAPSTHRYRRQTKIEASLFDNQACNYFAMMKVIIPMAEQLSILSFQANRSSNEHQRHPLFLSPKPHVTKSGSPERVGSAYSRFRRQVATRPSNQTRKSIRCGWRAPPSAPHSKFLLRRSDLKGT